MSRRALNSVFLLCAAFVTSIAVAGERVITFDERVRVQTAIERVYYSHQLGATRTFEQAVPHDFIEAKVKTYLKQSVALEKVWKTPVTDWMLERELERMAAGSRLPERLVELYAALGNDTFLIKECLARPALVDRLSRNFFAFDSRIHSETKAEADEIRARLAAGVLNPSLDHPSRSVAYYALRHAEQIGSENPRGQGDGGSPIRVALSPEEFRNERGKLPGRIEQVSGLQETREAFATRVVLEETDNEFQVASYVVPKLTWESWWTSREKDLAWEALEPIARDGVLPMPNAGAKRVWPSTAATGSSNWISGDGLPCVADDTWDNASLDDVPDPRRRAHTAVWTGTLMLIWGGTGDRYDPATDSWSPISAMGAPINRSQHTAVWTGSVMVVWGGDDYVGSHISTGGRYDPVNDSWVPVSSSGSPAARGSHTAVWTGSEMLVWGGMIDNGTDLNTGGRYDPQTDVWTPMSTVGAPSPRAKHTAVWTGSAMVVWGGAINGSPSSTNTGGRYNPVTNTWTATATTGAPSIRLKHSAIWTGSRMVIWGGLGQFGYVNDGGRYDPVANTWTAMATTGAPSARSGHPTVWTGSEMVVWGGATNSSPFSTNTGGRYNPTSDSWAPMNTAGAPSARYEHTAVWTGNRVVVWGGGGESGPVNTGGRYDPATDSWTPTALTSAPSPRFEHVAVWTGSLMVVFGGLGVTEELPPRGGRYDPALDLWKTTKLIGGQRDLTAVWTGSLMLLWGGGPNPGGRYDPVLDEWSPTSTLGAPAERYEHTAVWTGTEMLVWGGVNSQTGMLNTGGRYDPTNDSWAPISLFDAPTARRYHTAVWSGSSMLVWGGFDGAGGLLATGGRYDVATDHWLPTTMVGAPAARSFQKAVWTGTTMVVWGGTDFSSYFNTGGRYDPTTDSWAPTATLGAPAARRGHTAVWTGSKMVVWGGTVGGNNSHMNTGGLYEPILDSWTPTNNSGAPDRRFDHSAVWTGSAMIVWGGALPNDLTASGGSYVLGAAVDDDGDGYSECAGDCNDGNAAINVNAVEVCDVVDNDCDGIADNVDLDGDGFSACSDDCDDGNAATFPHAAQVCDGVNNDCQSPTSFWPSLHGTNEADEDNDGFSPCAGDCNESDPFMYPGSPELCDGRDNQCPGDPGYGQVDEDPLGSDTDQDGRGDLCDNCPNDSNPTQADADGDHTGDACDLDRDGDGFDNVSDNCPDVSNASQANDDNDPWGNACDICPEADDVAQVDTDRDSFGDACDNCPAISNRSQHDLDSDGDGDHCDDDDGLIYQFRLDHDHVDWQSEIGFDAWNLYEGDLQVLRATGDYTQEPGSNSNAARMCALLESSATRTEIPIAGSCAFSLVTGIQGGLEGDLGQDSSGSGRPNDHPCP